MKIRTGFVSNSSSSSFCIFGAIVPDDSRELTQGLDYKYGISDYAEEVLAGVEPWDMKRDETREQFEERITKEIQKIFGENTQCSWYTDGGYNG